MSPESATFSFSSDELNGPFSEKESCRREQQDITYKGNEYPWAEFLAMKLREFREAIEENDMLIARLDDCDEAIRENPDDVTEG